MLPSLSPASGRKKLNCHIFFQYGGKKIKLKSQEHYTMARAIRQCCKHYKLSGEVKIVVKKTGKEVISKNQVVDYSEQLLIITKRRVRSRSRSRSPALRSRSRSPTVRRGRSRSLSPRFSSVPEKEKQSSREVSKGSETESDEEVKAKVNDHSYVKVSKEDEKVKKTNDHSGYKKRYKFKEKGKFNMQKEQFNFQLNFEAKIRKLDLSLWKCRECGKEFSSDILVKRHSRKETCVVKPRRRTKAIKKTRCEDCPTIFLNRRLLRAHQAKVHPQPYTCHVCGVVVNRRCNWQRHKMIHKEPMIACSKCPYKSNRKETLKKHIKSKHGVKNAGESTEQRDHSGRRKTQDRDTIHQANVEDAGHPTTNTTPVPRVQFATVTVREGEADKSMLVVARGENISLYSFPKEETGMTDIWSRKMPSAITCISSKGDMLAVVCGCKVGFFSVSLSTALTQIVTCKMPSKIVKVDWIRSQEILIVTKNRVFGGNLNDPARISTLFDIDTNKQTVQTAQVAGGQLFVLAESGHLYSSKIFSDYVYVSLDEIDVREDTVIDIASFEDCLLVLRKGELLAGLDEDAPTVQVRP